MHQRFFEELQAEAMENAAELADADLIPDAAQRMWTSAKTISDREFCFIVNHAGRADTRPFVEPLAVFSRAINQQCVTRRGAGDAVRAPARRARRRPRPAPRPGARATRGWPG